MKVFLAAIVIVTLASVGAARCQQGFFVWPFSICDSQTYFQVEKTKVPKVIYNRNYVRPAPIPQPSYADMLPEVKFAGKHKAGTLRLHIHDPSGRAGDQVRVLRPAKRITVVPEVK